MSGIIKYLKSKLDSQSKILFKNTSWILGSNLIRTILVFIKSIFIARGLGVQLYGTFAIIAAFTIGMEEFFNLNVGGAFIKFGAEYKTNNRPDKLIALMKGSFYSTLFTAALSLIILAFIIKYSYTTIITKPGLEIYIFLYAISEVVTFFEPLSRSFLRLYYKFKINSIIQTINSLIEFIAVCLTILLFPKNIYYFIVVVSVVKIFGAIVTIGVGFWELRNEIFPHINVKVTLIRNQWKEIFNFIIGNSLSKTLLTVMNQADTFLIGSMAGPVHAGFYNISKRLASSVASLSDPFNLSIFPQLSLLLSEKKYKEIKTMLIKITRMAALPGAVFIIAVWLLNDFIIQTAYGKQYLPAAVPFAILTISTVLNSIFFWSQPMMQSFGLIRFRFFTYLICMAVGALFAWLLIPSFFANGLAISVLIMQILINLIFILATIKLLRTENELPLKVFSKK